MAFADAFSAENVQRLMSDPRMVLGLQMMQQSGWQPGNPSGGQRLGQAGIGAMQQIAQQQHSQQLQAYRQQMIAQQQADLQMRQQAAQAKVEQQQRQSAAIQSPEFQAQLGPLARSLAQAGMNPADLLRAQGVDNLQAHRAQQLQQQAQQFDMRQVHQGGGQPSAPKAPTPRQLIEEPLPDGRVQKHLFDATTQTYKPYGAPFNPHSTRVTSVKADPLHNVVSSIMQGTPDEEPGLGSLPGGAPLASYAPQQNPTPPIVAGGAVPGNAREPMRVPGISQQYPGAPAVGTIRKGYKYLGGNPADKASWSKI